jgi:hypothetical protein
MGNKQTAVEWLESELKKQGFLYDLDIEAAKAMEKDQIIDAHFEGWGDAYDYLKDETTEARQAEDYYNETYSK